MYKLCLLRRSELKDSCVCSINEDLIMNVVSYMKYLTKYDLFFFYSFL